jgi:hypothetical protein
VEKEFHSADLAKEKISAARKFQQAVPSKAEVREFHGGSIQPAGVVKEVVQRGQHHTTRMGPYRPRVANVQPAASRTAYSWAVQAVVHPGGH